MWHPKAALYTNRRAHKGEYPPLLYSSSLCILPIPATTTFGRIRILPSPSSLGKAWRSLIKIFVNGRVQKFRLNLSQEDLAPSSSDSQNFVILSQTYGGDWRWVGRARGCLPHGKSRQKCKSRTVLGTYLLTPQTIFCNLSGNGGVPSDCSSWTRGAHSCSSGKRGSCMVQYTCLKVLKIKQFC